MTTRRYSRCCWTGARIFKPRTAAAGRRYMLPHGTTTTREVAALLLDRGADLEAKAKNDNGRTPLHLAAWWNDNPEMVELLLDRGANIEAQDDYGSTPLHLATTIGNNPEVAALLLNRGADIEARDDNVGTPLHWAANNPEVTALLLDRGADIAAKGHAGSTPAALGSREGSQPGSGCIAAEPGRRHSRPGRSIRHAAALCSKL